MRWTTFALLFALTDTIPGFAQSPLEPPLAGRPTNFSHLVGRFSVSSAAEPLVIIIENPITVRIVIQGTPLDKVPPTRATLQLFPDDLTDNFYIEPVADQDKAKPDEGSWEFVWRLRPKALTVREIPSWKLVYYSPAVRRYQTATSEPVSIIVKPRPEIRPEQPELPLSERIGETLDLAAWPATPKVSSPESHHQIGDGAILAIALLLATLSWYWAGRSPRSTAKTSRQTHDVRVRAALAGLANQPENANDILTRYLEDSLGRPLGEPVPNEIDRLLKRRGVAKSLRESLVTWFSQSAARRFSPVPQKPDVAVLAQQAITLIRQMEADRCFAS